MRTIGSVDTENGGSVRGMLANVDVAGFTPKASRRLAGGKRRRTRHHRILGTARDSTPAEVVEGSRSPQKPFIEFDLVFRQETKILILERMSMMVFHLLGNVLANSCNVRTAYGEPAV